MGTSLDTLHPEPVTETVRRLRSRIAERFPDRNLVHVVDELLGLVVQVRQQGSVARGWFKDGSAVVDALVIGILDEPRAASSKSRK